jgi:hypothetical protein
MPIRKFNLSDEGIEAEYETPCAADCGERIYPGDRIVQSEEDGGWIHKECKEEDE